MKKLLIILFGPLLLGPAGYILGKMMAPEPTEIAEIDDKPAAEMAEKTGEVAATPKEILYKMPLGKFTVQVMQPRTTLHLVIDMDVYLAGASEFERLNGSEGRARLRDSAIGILSDMAETSLWVDEGEESNIDTDALIEELVRKMHRSFAAIRTARINEFNHARMLRL